MINLRQAFSRGSGRGGWHKFLRALERVRARGAGLGSTRLHEISDFGSNPGNLRMFSYRPSTLADNSALVVGSRMHPNGSWIRSRGRMVDPCGPYGFALLLPEQQRSNNPNGCFNWFPPSTASATPVNLLHSADDRKSVVITASIGGESSSPVFPPEVR